MDTHYLLTVIVPAVAVLLVIFGIERILSRYVTRFGKDRELSTSHIFRVKAILRWSIFLVTLIIVASIFGIGIENIWITLSTMALTILVAFFAMWSILSNLLSFVIVVLTRQFDIDDKLTILPENISGKVVSIGLFHTKLLTESNELLYVPNITFPTKFVQVKRSRWSTADVEKEDTLK